MLAPGLVSEAGLSFQDLFADLPGADDDSELKCRAAEERLHIFIVTPLEFAPGPFVAALPYQFY